MPSLELEKGFIPEDLNNPVVETQTIKLLQISTETFPTEVFAKGNEFCPKSSR